MLDTHTPLKAYCAAPGLFDIEGKSDSKEVTQADLRELRQGQGYLPVYNSSTMMERTGGDLSLIREIVEYFFEESPQILGQLKDAVDKNDTRAVEHASNTMQTSIEFFGAEPALRAAQRLESLSKRDNWKHTRRAYDRFELEFIRLWNSLTPLLKRNRKTG
jgi:HPt (histidine-containing phosphotransfer) domain-containing protein